MRIAAIIVGSLVALVLVVVAIGYALPQRHRAMRERVFPAPPNQVFAIIAAPDSFPTWRSGVQRVEMLPSTDGRTRFREVGGDGAITFVVDSSEPGRRLITRIDDASLPFGGSWTYELSPATGGTSLRITEDGEVYNPVFRFASRFVLGHHHTIDKYLDDLDRRLEANRQVSRRPHADP